MSLILEALKKLERDRHTQERGFLVLSQPAWRPAGESHWTRGPAWLGVAALGGAAVAAALLWSPRAQPTPVPAAVREIQAPAVPVQASALSSSSTATASAAVPPPRVAWPADPRARGTKAAAALAAPLEARSVAALAPVAEPAAEAEREGEPPPEADPGAEPAAVAGPLRLEAIAQRDGQPVAVVSGQLVRVGDVIGASTVVRIGAAEIELETDGVRRVLKF